MISATGGLRGPSRSSGVSSATKRKVAAYAGVAVGLVTIFGLVGWGASSLTALANDDSVSVIEVVTAPSSALAAREAGDGCSAGSGDLSTGKGVITALEYRYYLMRSGLAVRELMAPDAALPDAAVVQAGIDSVPLGTTHCVAVAEIGPNEFAATITEKRPGGKARTFKQRIGTVASPDGRVLIKTISEVGE